MSFQKQWTSVVKDSEPSEMGNKQSELYDYSGLLT